ncbi:MAG: hypothetical protein AB1523_09025 [Bacillota bacterium]
MDRCRLLIYLVMLVLGLSGLNFFAAAREESVPRAVSEERAQPSGQEEIRGIWGRAETSFAFARRVYWFYPVQNYAGLDPRARRLVDEWVSLANRRIEEYRKCSDDYLQLGLPVGDLVQVAVKNEEWEVRLDRVQFALKPASCRYYLIARRLAA